MLAPGNLTEAKKIRKKKRPNLIYVFADQWRAQSTGYAGDKHVITPFLNLLASESLCFDYAVSNTPVSTPYRGTLMTGQYPFKHGLFMNDVQLNPDADSLAKSYKAAGYETAYIGKWHINGHGRSTYIPREWRQGFDYFKVLECTHDYNHSKYYDNDDPNVKVWEGYDAYYQTLDAQKYIKQHANGDQPFILFLSWGPPHGPYMTAPQKFRDLYKDMEIEFRPNVPEKAKELANKEIRGYYAHMTALDECMGMLQNTIKEAGIDEDTIFVFTSDHGDMMGSQGFRQKQKPYDESIRVPFLLKYPALFGKKGKKADTIISAVDIMPTLLGLSGIPIPEAVQGRDLSPILRGEEKDTTDAALISCVTPFGEWERRRGGKEYRGVRTRRYTYVEDLNGPWLFFDNEKDPYQMTNLVGNESHSSVQKEMAALLRKKLKECGDEFLTGPEYIKKWHYKPDKNGSIPG